MDTHNSKIKGLGKFSSEQPLKNPFGNYTIISYNTGFIDAIIKEFEWQIINRSRYSETYKPATELLRSLSNFISCVDSTNPKNQQEALDIFANNLEKIIPPLKKQLDSINNQLDTSPLEEDEKNLFLVVITYTDRAIKEKLETLENNNEINILDLCKKQIATLNLKKSDDKKENEIKNHL